MMACTLSGFRFCNEKTLTVQRCELRMLRAMSSRGHLDLLSHMLYARRIDDSGVSCSAVAVADAPEQMNGQQLSH